MLRLLYMTPVLAGGVQHAAAHTVSGAGQPVSLAAVGVNRSQSLPEQVSASPNPSKLKCMLSSLWLTQCVRIIPHPCRASAGPFSLILVVLQQAAALAQGITNLLPQLGALSVILPPDTLAWKLRMLDTGNQFIKDRLKSVSQRGPAACRRRRPAAAQRQRGQTPGPGAAALRLQGDGEPSQLCLLVLACGIQPVV